MAETSPISQRQRKLQRQMCRITMLCGSHRWTFAFSRRDATAAARRVMQLARDPLAPLDWSDAGALCRHIARFHAEASSPHFDVPAGPDSAV